MDTSRCQIYAGHQPEHDRPHCLVPLQVDQQLAEGPRLRVTQNVPIASESGSVRTWSSSARGADRGRRDALGVGTRVRRVTRLEATRSNRRLRVSNPR